MIKRNTVLSVGSGTGSRRPGGVRQRRFDCKAGQGDHFLRGSGRRRNQTFVVPACGFWSVRTRPTRCSPRPVPSARPLAWRRWPIPAITPSWPAYLVDNGMVSGEFKGADTGKTGTTSFSLIATPGSKLYFATMVAPTNDWFAAPAAGGIDLFDEDGAVNSAASTIYVWDAGTEMEDAATGHVHSHVVAVGSVGSVECRPGRRDGWRWSRIVAR